MGHRNYLFNLGNLVDAKTKLFNSLVGTNFYNQADMPSFRLITQKAQMKRKEQTLFKFLLTATMVSLIAFIACDKNVNKVDSSSAKTKVPENEPTKYNSGSNTSTRTEGSMGLNNQDNDEQSNFVSENHGKNSTPVSGQLNINNTQYEESTKNLEMDTFKNITINSELKNQNTRGNKGTTGQTGRAAGIR